MKYFRASICFAAAMLVNLAVPGARAAAESAASAGTDFETGRQLVESCTMKSMSIAHFGCLGFVHGVIVEYERSHGKFFCKADRLTLDDESAVIERYSIDHPERLGDSALTWIIEAMQNSYPCP